MAGRCAFSFLVLFCLWLLSVCTLVRMEMRVHSPDQDRQSDRERHTLRTLRYFLAPPGRVSKKRTELVLRGGEGGDVRLMSLLLTEV